MKHTETSRTDSGALPPAELDAPTDADVLAIRKRWENWATTKGLGNYVVPDIRALLASDARLRAENGRLREALDDITQSSMWPINSQVTVIEMQSRARRALAGEGHPTEGNDGLR